MKNIYSATTVVIEGKENDQCSGYHPKTGKPYPACGYGLECLPYSVYFEPGQYDICKPAPHHNFYAVKLAKEGELCEGYNTDTFEPFPDCEDGLTCTLRAGHPADGQEKACFAYADFYAAHPIQHHAEVVQHHAEVVQHHVEVVGLGETCEGLNEATGEPYPFCEAGLECGIKIGFKSMPGAGNACFDPHHMMDNNQAPFHLYDPMKYPFLADDFFDSEPVFVTTLGSYEHASETPGECEYCTKAAEKIEYLEDEVDDLEDEIKDLKYEARRYSKSESTSRYESKSKAAPTYESKSRAAPTYENKHQPEYNNYEYKEYKSYVPSFNLYSKAVEPDLL